MERLEKADTEIDQAQRVAQARARFGAAAAGLEAEAAQQRGAGVTTRRTRREDRAFGGTDQVGCRAL